MCCVWPTLVLKMTVLKGMDKRVVVHGILLSYKKNEHIESFLKRWMKLEPIIQSEVSHKEKHHYSILTHIYGI